MVNLKTRLDSPEIMDDFDLPAEEIIPVLKGLGKVNAIFGGHAAIINALKKFPIKSNYSIADWGCGGGDTLIAIAKWADKNNFPLNFIGIDASPATVEFARGQSSNYKNIRYVQADVLDDKVKINTCDIIICSLFTHHFDDAQWVQLINSMYQTAGKGIIITDLHRHWLLYYAVVLITKLTGNTMVQNDGPLSVQRSFKRRELITLLFKTQIDNFKLTWKWPFRWELTIYKP